MIIVSSMPRQKRIEYNLGWTCNFDCIFCTEKENKEKFQGKMLSQEEIKKQLLSFKQQGYTHITFLGGEPFLQENFYYALLAAKALHFQVLVTSNGTLLQSEDIARKHLPLIDELIISLHSLDPASQKQISQIKNEIDYDLIFININKYHRGQFKKVNTVISSYNYQDISPIAEFLVYHRIKEFSITYPDFCPQITRYQGNFSLKYSEIVAELAPVAAICQANNIRLRICDIPLCVLGELGKYSEDLCYAHRVKLESNGEYFDRDSKLPRKRNFAPECQSCVLKGKCWGIGIEYYRSFGTAELKALFEIPAGLAGKITTDYISPAVKNK